MMYLLQQQSNLSSASIDRRTLSNASLSDRRPSEPSKSTPLIDSRPVDALRSLSASNIHPTTPHQPNGTPHHNDTPTEEPIELDPDYIECIHDFLITLSPESEEEALRLRQFLDVFLSRFCRRLDRKYSVADSFAASAVGARRLMSYLGFTTNEQTQTLEYYIARTLAGLLMDAKTVEEVMERQGMDVAATHLDTHRHRTSTDRSYLVDQLVSEYLRRADTWTPATAAKASQMRRKRTKRERFLSIFMELEEAKIALRLNAQDAAHLPSHPHQDVPRKKSSDQGRYERAQTPTSTRRPSLTQDRKPSSPGVSAPMARRGSAEALLQSVLDECETLIGSLHVNTDRK